MRRAVRSNRKRKRPSNPARSGTWRRFLVLTAGVMLALGASTFPTSATQQPPGRTVSESTAVNTSGYETLFDGTARSLENWTQVPPGAFTLQPNGSVRSSGGLGMLWYSAKEFEDFSLEFEYRDVAPKGHRANSGVLVRFPDPRTPPEQRPEGSCGTKGAARDSAAWVAIYCGHEVQINDASSGDPQKTGSIYNFVPLNLDQAGVTPKGRWNTVEIRVVGQHYTVVRNGEVINEFHNTPGKEASREGDPPTDLRQFTSGFIALQNHGEADLVEFRDIRAKKL